MSKRIGTILHGALGDCYEQLCAIKLLRNRSKNDKWIGFFAVNDRMIAMQHYVLDMLDEIYPVIDIEKIEVDTFYQFQINDIELNENILSSLDFRVRNKFDFNKNRLPWQVLRSYNYTSNCLKLELSDEGHRYLPICCYNNNVTDELFATTFTIGYLWRYRSKGGAVNPMFQKSKEWILKSKSELFQALINEYNAHIIVAGMNISSVLDTNLQVHREIAGVLTGECNSKFSDSKLDIPNNKVTYLKGLGFAAEMEIMSRCNLLLLMPSGFSEPLWMRHSEKVILIDPPPVYLAKLLRHRMPFFNNNRFKYFLYNNFVTHNKKNVISFIEKQKLISSKP